jgi:hypothetical protein
MGDGCMNEHRHFEMIFDNGKLICLSCGQDVTPPPGIQIKVYLNPSRELELAHLAKIATDLSEEDLLEIELYAEFIKSRSTS